MPAPTRTPARRGRPPKAAPTRAAFQEPLIAKEENLRPTEHRGIPVEREELLSNLPSGSPFKVTRLHLANGEKAWGCRDCLFTADLRREVQQHRNDEHGAKFGKKTPKIVYLAKADDGDLVLPPRPDGNPAPSDAMQMTVAELLALVPSIGAISDLIDKVERERDTALTELQERRKHDRENQHKIDVYESHQEQLLDLRLMVRNTGSYEQLKAEVMALRTWKKNVIAKLSKVGFVLNEEEEEA